jgi:SAM-dependent methyltransferase
MTVEYMLSAAGYVQSELDAVWHRESYSGIAYSDGDGAEEALLAVLRASSDLSVFSPELAIACVDWPSRYHLSSERANLLRPFARHLGPGARVLEIGAGCGAVTRYLGEAGAEVLALEGSPRRARIARERTRDLHNVQVVAERFQDFALSERFDVITLIGVLEYASLFSDAAQPALHMLQAVRGLLAPSGRLVLAIENQLGLKYFAGVPEDHLGQPMVGLEDRYPAIGARTYGRLELERMLTRAGYREARFSAPLPDYKMPATVLTERGLDASLQAFDVGALVAQAVRRDPQLTPTTFNLQRSWPVVASNGLAMDLANSFLVEAVSETGSLPEEPVLAYHYSTQRLARYARETLFVQQVDGSVVVNSRSLGDDAIASNATVLLRVEQQTPYHRGSLIAESIQGLLSEPGWTREVLIDHVRSHITALGELLASEGHSLDLDRLDTELPGDFIDATPGNLIRLDNGRVAYFDREWVVQHPTLGWLLWRSLLFLYGGTIVAPMASGEAEGPLLRKLLLDVLSAIFGEQISEQAWLVRELDFQRDVTGKDQTDAIEGMLNAPVPRLEAVSAPVAGGSDRAMQHELMDGIASLRHVLNLSSQHDMHTYAAISSLHSELNEGFKALMPAMQRLLELSSNGNEGQLVLQDRLVRIEDALSQATESWGAERGATGRRLDEMIEIQVEHGRQLQALHVRKWWKFW